MPSRVAGWPNPLDTAKNAEPAASGMCQIESSLIEVGARGRCSREVTRHDARAKTVPMAKIRLMEPVRLGEYCSVDNLSRISEKWTLIGN